MITKTVRFGQTEETWTFDNIGEYIDWVSYNLSVYKQEKKETEEILEFLTSTTKKEPSVH